MLVIFPLLSLMGIYAFATALTANDAITLERATSIRNSLNDPIGLFEAQIQAERLLATTYLADPSAQNLAELTGQEALTKRFLSVFLAQANSAATDKNSSPQVKAGLKILLKDIAGLPALHHQISTRTIDISQAQNAYSAIVAAGYKTIIQTVLEMPNAHLQTQALAVMSITQGAELLLQEQAFFMGHAMTRSFSAYAHQRFAHLVGERQGLLAEAMPALDPVYQSFFRKAVSPATTAALTGLENRVIDTPPGVVPRVPPLAFEQAAGAVAMGLNLAGYRAGEVLADYGYQVARPAYLRLVLAGGLGLLAIMISIATSILVGRSLVRELGGLKMAALDLANKRLPDVVARLSSGEDVVEADVEVPFPDPTSDEIGQVRQAFNSVQRTAIEAAVSQARLRASIAIVFRNLARRSQSLLHRQLAILDDLELHADKPEELDSLFKIDHLTTRMRRHAEGLVVLAGDRPGRGWNRAVPLADVLRAAVAEVEDYRRVEVTTKSRAALAGRTIADVIHLLAELIENAALFSPPNTPVRVVGDLVARGIAVEIEDRGLGIAEETLAGLNAKLADPPRTDPAETEQLGLYVAARLARQHQIRITLRDSPFGGTTAVVLIPQDLVVSEESYTADPEAGFANELAVQATGRHAVRGYFEPAPVDTDPDQERLRGGTALPAAVPRQAAPVEPPEAGTAQPTREETARAFPLDRVDQAERQLDAGEKPQATAADLTTLGLPLRTPQANLVPQLRDPQSQDAPSDNGGASSERSPSEVRDAFTALQRGWERGRSESAETGPAAASGPYGGSQRSGQHGADTSGPSAGSESEGTA
jgi:signal transduction histidine kinase